MIISMTAHTVLFINLCQVMSEAISVKKLAFKSRQNQAKTTGCLEVIDIDKISYEIVKEPSMWVDNLNREDERVLLENEWLTDRLINAGQDLIKSCYSQVRGLQNVSLGKTLAFEVMKGEFIQILHTGRDHWVTISIYSRIW